MDKPKPPKKRYQVRLHQEEIDKLKKIAYDLGFIYRGEGSIHKMMTAIVDEKLLLSNTQFNKPSANTQEVTNLLNKQHLIKGLYLSNYPVTAYKKLDIGIVIDMPKILGTIDILFISNHYGVIAINVPIINNKDALLQIQYNYHNWLWCLLAQNENLVKKRDLQVKINTATYAPHIDSLDNEILLRNEADLLNFFNNLEPSPLHNSYELLQDTLIDNPDNYKMFI